MDIDTAVIESELLTNITLPKTNMEGDLSLKPQTQVCSSNGSPSLTCKESANCLNTTVGISSDLNGALLSEPPLIVETKEEMVNNSVKFVKRSISTDPEQATLEKKESHVECENQIAQYQREIELFKQEHELDIRTQATMQVEIDALKKQYVIANKERETIVMRYAMSEMELINQRKMYKNLEKKLNESLKEKECLSTKLKMALTEKIRINNLFDTKCSDLGNVQRDVEKLKEELTSKEIKIKWSQNKLKSEIEIRKESEAKIDQLSNKLLEAKEEIERSKKEAESAIKQFQCSQENRAYVLEQQLTELQAQLILERHNSEDKENKYKKLQQHFETLQNKHLLLVDESNALKLKVSSLEREEQDHHLTVSRLQECVNESSLEINQLQEKTSTLENLKLQLQQEREKVEVLQSEVAQLQSSNMELQQDMASCREREADMLEFTQKVTAKNVRLQSDYSCIEAKARQLEFEEEPLQKRIDESLKKIVSLEKELSQERIDRTEEKKLVARHLAEKTARLEVLTQELDNLKGENQVLKHKHSVTLRELNREIQQCRKRIEQYENSAGSDSNCQGSSDGSCNSLNQSPLSTSVAGINQAEPNTQTMIDRILKLQRENVKFREKIDFLEEHSKQLVAELQKKTRVLQSYILREEAGMLTSNSMDFHKAELLKQGGIMASVYGSKPVDDSMTLELSLEINRKLQAVLEDTLIKNITLKENLDTLGDEIRRLSKKS